MASWNDLGATGAGEDFAAAAFFSYVKLADQIFNQSTFTGQVELTSILNKNAFKSLNLNELPTDMVWAVSPAQKRPCVFRHSFLRTKIVHNNQSKNEDVWLTKSVY